MWRLYLSHFATALVVSLVSAQTGMGQLVVVRPGFVKAPFVRVYSYPDGSSYVRAPFVGVHSPGYAPYPQYVQGWPIPAREDYAAMDWLSLRSTIRASAAGLDAQLNRFPTGDVWRMHLQTRAILDTIAADVNGPPAVAELDSILQILPNYDAALTNSDLRSITNLPNFRVLHAALQEFMKPAQQRLYDQLSLSLQNLHQSLGRFTTGATWQDYLAAPEPFGATGDAPTKEPGESAPGDLQPWQDLADRFDSVLANQEYHMIAGLPEFIAARQRLAEYLELLNQPPIPRPAAPIEELPPPVPED